MAIVPGRPSAPRRREVPPADPRADRRARALETPLDVRARADPRFVRLEVRNPVHQTHYDVLLPSYPDRDGAFCTCVDFARRGAGTCKHLEAALMWAADHSADIPWPGPATPPGSDRWESIDRHLKAQGRSRAPLPLRFRIGGSALMEP